MTLEAIEVLPVAGCKIELLSDGTGETVSTCFVTGLSWLHFTALFKLSISLKGIAWNGSDYDWKIEIEIN